jgi:hypothetical protein
VFLLKEEDVKKLKIKNQEELDPDQLPVEKENMLKG